MLHDLPLRSEYLLLYFSSERSKRYGLMKPLKQRQKREVKLLVLFLCFCGGAKLEPLNKLRFIHILVLKMMVVSYLELYLKSQETLFRPPQMFKQFATKQINIT